MNKVPSHFKLCTLVALLAASLSVHAQTLPAGMTVVAGQAQAALNGKQLTITNTNNTILNWQSFSIGAGAGVNFVQPSSASKVLNRVTGSDPSSIFGSLTSNGQVWLLNPNGVLFGQGARVDVASLVTSTLNTNDSDWLAGRNLLTGSSSASVENQGEITTALGGRVALVANAVSNSGAITTDGGQIILAAGQSVELVDTGAPNLAVKVTAPTGSVVNLGSLNAAGGRIDVMAAAVNQQGLVQADSLGTGPAGEIVLQADQRLTLTAGSSTHADGNTGGVVHLLGYQIDLQDGSAVSASGALAGGTVLVGGGAQGQDTSVPNADAVYFAPGASIAADATQNGDGGHIVLWSNSATRAFGSLSATGGASGGNGGLIETSGGWLAADPTALNLSAPNGKAGTWLLDPYNITISPNADSNYDASFTATGDDAVINVSTLANALSLGNNVTVSTSGATPAGTQAGNITFGDVALNVSSATNVTLTLKADGDITAPSGLDVGTFSSPGTLSLNFQAGLSGAGAISLTDSTLSTNGGSITLQGVGHAGLPDGVLLSQVYLSAGTGNISITGNTSEAGGRGVVLLNNVTSGNNGGGGAITLTGTSTSGNGVEIDSGVLTASGAFNITGNGGVNGISIDVINSTTNPIELGGASMTLSGTSSGTGAGVLINATVGQASGSSPPVLNATSASGLTITGTNQPGGSPALSVTGANDDSDQWDSSSAFTLNAYGGGMLISGISAVNSSTSIAATSDAGLTWQNVNFEPDGPVSLQGGTVTLNTVDLNAVGTPNIVVSSVGDLSLSGTYLAASDASSPMPITLHAGTGGTGSLSLISSTLYSSGGPIVLTNGGTSASANGVSLVESSVNTDSDGGAGTVQITGKASGTGTGILLDVSSTPENGNTIYGSDVALTGTSTGGTGVAINVANVTATSALSIQGAGGQRGLALVVGDPDVSPITLSGAGLTLTGQSAGTGYGVLIDDTAGLGSGGTAVLTASGGLSLSIAGFNQAGGSPALAFLGPNDSSSQFDTTGALILNATGGGMLVSGVSAASNAATISANSDAALTWQNDTFNPLGAVTLQGGTVSLSSVDVYTFGASSIAITSSGDLSVSSSTLESTSSSIPISLSAGIGGTGSLSLSSSTLVSMEGDITLSNVGTTAGGSGAGVSLVGVTMSETGALQITGHANGSGTGVLVDVGGAPSLLTTDGMITMTGTSSTGTGVQINNGQLTSHSGTIAITGTGGGNGVVLSEVGANDSVGVNSNGNLTLTGTSTGTGYGVLASETAGGSSNLALASYGGVTITGSNAAGGSSAVALTASNSGGLTLTAYGGVNVQATGGGLAFSNLSESGSVDDNLLSSSSTLNLANSTLGGIGGVTLEAQNVTLSGSTVLSSHNDLLVAGPGGTVPAQTFTNTAGSSAFSVLVGYSTWLIWLQDATQAGNLTLGGLAYDFKVYGATSSSAWGSYPGNGIASQASENATVTGTTASRAYDGTTTASVSNLVVTPGVSGDQAGSISTYTANYADPNAATGKAVTVNFSAPPEFEDSTGHPVYGYTIVDGVSGDITPALLTASVSANTKTYDGTTGATLAVGTISGLVGSETVGMNATGNFVDKNAGTGKAITGTSFVLSDGTNGGLASNYTFQPSASITGDITPAALSVSVANVSKSYDGTTSVSGGVAAVSSGTLFGSDTLSGGTFAYTDKNAGSGNKDVTVAGVTVNDGNSGGNYTVTYTDNTSSSITPASLSVSVGNVSKTYDGTATVSGGTAMLSGGTLFGSDSLSGGSFAYSDKNAGAGNKTVSVSGVTINDGDSGADYTVSYVNNTTSTITPASLTVSGLTASNKVYDATTAASVSTSAAILTGVFSGDTVGVSVTPTGATFSDPNVGTSKTVTASGFVLSGADAGNYSVAGPVTLQASITPATLTYVAQPVQLLSGVPLPIFAGTVSGFVGNDTQSSATTGTLGFYASASDTAAAGSYAINGQGLNAANYTFVQAAGNATALTVSGAGPAQTQVQSSTVPIQQTQAILSIPTPTDTPTAGLVDLTPPLPTAVAGSDASFSSAPLSSMSSAAVADMLGARAGFMQNLLGEGLAQLQQNPGLADVVPCKSLEEAETGTCAMTKELKQAARNRAEHGWVASASVPAPVVPPLAVPPVAAAPARAPLVAPVPLTASAPAPMPWFKTRTVKQAALPAIQRKMAVLIGEGHYSDASIPALGNADGDAHALAAVLGQKLGYETLVLDNPSKEAVLATLNRLVLETRPQDSVVIYYAGHGALADTGGEGYWIMSNSNAQQPKTWLSNGDIARLISQIDARQLALISDSCYSGSLVGAEHIRGVPGKADPDAMLARRGAVVMSSGGNEPVFDSGRDGHSLFAWALMKNLDQVSSWQPGGNLFERVRFAVARVLPQRPQYGAAPGYQEGADYLFEVRELNQVAPASQAAAQTTTVASR